MANQVAARKVYPYAGLIIGGRAGYDDQLIAGVYACEMFGAFAEDGTMDGRPEAARPVWRQGRVSLGACFHSSIFGRDSYAPRRFPTGAG